MIKITQYPCTRNIGPVVFQLCRKSGLVLNFWTSCSSFIQKILFGPEILDQLYFINTDNNLGWSRFSGPFVISSIQKIWGGPEILEQLYFIHTESLGRSRNSGPVVFHSYRNLGWSRFSGPVVLHSYRKSGLVQKFWICRISFIQTI